MDRFRYQVMPFTPINDLIPGKSLRRPFSCDLTKEEVLHCMKKGPVYRLFTGMSPIRVTGSNIDQLHKQYFEEKNAEAPSNTTTKEEFTPVEIEVVTENTETEAPTEEIFEETTQVVEEDPVVEEVQEEVIPEETVVEEEILTIEEVNEVPEEQVETIEEIPVEEEVIDGEEIQETPIPPILPNMNAQFRNPQNNNYGKKKKHH